MSDRASEWNGSTMDDIFNGCNKWSFQVTASQVSIRTSKYLELITI